MERTITTAEARQILERPGYDAYGLERIYAETATEIRGIKSTYQLDRLDVPARLYVKTNDGTVPVRKA